MSLSMRAFRCRGALSLVEKAVTTPAAAFCSVSSTTGLAVAIVVNNKRLVPVSGRRRRLCMTCSPCAVMFLTRQDGLCGSYHWKLDPFATIAPVSPPSSRHLPVLGITLKLASLVVFAGMMVCIKFLGQDIPAGQTIFARGLISVATLALLAWSTGRLHLLKTTNCRSHALRSLSGTVSMF